MRGIASLLFVGLTALVNADGGVFTYDALAPPMIPSQRALVAFKDGTEAMIVESAVRGDAGAYGWLVPVPSNEVKVETVSPGLFETLEARLLPTFGYFNGRSIVVAAWAVASAIVLLVVLLARKRNGMSPVEFVIATLVIGVLAFIVGPAVDRATLDPATTGTAATDGGAQGPEWRQVGGYLFAEVNGATTNDPVKWLKDEGFAARGAEPTIKEYLDEGWSFVALKFDRDNTGEHGPHPIKLTFATETPVYPMRLTAHNTDELALDLYVVSRGAPAVDGLRLLFTSEITGDASWAPVGHPELRLVARPGDRLSRLQGEFTRGGMEEDLTIGTAEGSRAEPVRLWSSAKAWNRLLWHSLLAFAVTAYLFAFVIVFAKPSGRAFWTLTAVALAVLVGLIMKTRTGMVIVETEARVYDRMAGMSRYVVRELDKNREWTDRQEILAAVQRAHGPNQESDTPGGFVIIEEPEAFRVVTFDEAANADPPLLLKKKG